MEYRKIPKSDKRISVLGMGSSPIGVCEAGEISKTVEYALEHGVNYFDMAGNYGKIFAAYGEVLKDCRKDVVLQVHFGADYSTGEYGWTTDLDKIKASVDRQLTELKTDYMDLGYIHCLDERKDFQNYERGGVLDYILELKSQGVVHQLGFSTHSPEMANELLDRQIIDMLMFSINPMYDYGQGDYAIGAVNDRYDLYRRCEKECVGIVAMKPFAGGKLLDAKQSPFGVALTTDQCLRYVLDKPGVLATVPGPGTLEQMKEILKYTEATDEECDYSVIAGCKPDESAGQCVYCRHCHPCPAGLDIGLINKYYDLARMGDILAKEHYLTLEKTASDCIGCGHCDSRCPFGVKQSERMQEIREYFLR